MVDRGISGDLGRRRYAVGRCVGCERVVHAERRWTESEACRQSEQCRRRLGRRGSDERRRARHDEAAARTRASPRHRAPLHGVVPERRQSVTAFAAREHHRFEAAGKPFVYLVPSAAIFELDAESDAVLRALKERPRTREDLLTGGASSALTGIDDALAELARVQAIGIVDAPEPPKQKVIPLTPFPLTTMV